LTSREEAISEDIKMIQNNFGVSFVISNLDFKNFFFISDKRHEKIALFQGMSALFKAIIPKTFRTISR
jgi:hypothetical protein